MAKPTLTIKKPRRAKPRERRARCDSEIDWTIVRDDYEHTAASVRELCRRHGISSDTAVRRRVEREKWRRDTAEITAHLVTEGVADRDVQRAACAENPSNITVIDGVALDDDAQGVCSGDDCTQTPLLRVPKLPPPPIPRTAPHLEEGDRRVTTAKRLAEQHILAIGEQLDWAEAAGRVGTMLLDSIAVVLRGPGLDNEHQAAFIAARTALAMVSPDKETLANLSKAALTVLEGAAVMKRRALVMDPKPSVGAQGAMMGGIPSFIGVEQGAVQQVIRRLTPEALSALRKTALEISRLPRGELAPPDSSPA